MGSDGYSTDDYSTDGKRKREDKGDGDVFKKSKKTPRTPRRTDRRSSEDKLDKLMAMMQDLMSDVKLIRKEQSQFKEEITILKQENKNMKKENELLKNEIKGLHTQIEILDKKERRNNIIIAGIPLSNQNDQNMLQIAHEFIEKYLNLKVNIKNAYKIGPKSCLVEMNNNHDKVAVMKNKHKLKELKDEKIYINNDCTKNERKIEIILKRIAKEEIEKKNEVRIGYQKIIINGEKWIWNDSRNELEKVQPLPRPPEAGTIIN